jgi:hypothetical protein
MADGANSLFQALSSSPRGSPLYGFVVSSEPSNFLVSHVIADCAGPVWLAEQKERLDA